MMITTMDRGRDLCWPATASHGCRANLALKADRDDHRVPRRQRRRRDRPRAGVGDRAAGRDRISWCSTATAPPARSASPTLAAAAPDGHTIAFGPTTPIANAPYLVKGVRYNVEFVLLHLSGVRERVRDRGRPAIKDQVGAGAARGGESGSRQADLWPCRARHHPASLDGEHGRRAESQIRGGAVPRRCAAGSGAAARRGRFRRRRRVDHPPAAGDPPARDLLRQAPSGLSGHPDREGARRRDQRAARTQRAVCAARACRPRSATRSKRACRAILKQDVVRRR